MDIPDAPNASNCLLRSDNGVITSTHEPVTHLDCVIDVGPFRSQMHLLESITFADIKYQSVLFFSFSGEEKAGAFYDKLLENACDIIGVNCVEPNVCTAVCRRTAVRKKFKLGDLKIDQIYTLKHIRGGLTDKFNCAVFLLIDAWQKTGKSSKVNFELNRAVPLLTVDDLKQEWMD